MASNSVTRFARHSHRWIGAVLALFLLTVSVTGVALIWKDSYLGLVFAQPEHQFDVAAVIGMAEAAEVAFGAEGIAVAQFNEATHLTRVILRDGQAAYLGVDGAVLDVWSANGRPEEWVLDLHHRFLSGTRGLYVAGGVGIAALIAIGLGLIAYWPTRRAWRQGMHLRSGARVHLQLAHRNSGVVLALPLAVLVLSGVFLTFPTISRELLIWGQGADTYGETFGDGVDDLEGPAQATWPRAIERAVSVFPDAQITGLTWPNGGNERVIHLRTASEWNVEGNSSVQITASDGYMDLRIAAQDYLAGERFYNLMGALHTSQLGGLIYQVMQTVVGLGLAWLAVLGLAAFMRKPLG